MAQDITERKPAEDALRDTTEKLHALIESSPLAIMAFSPDGSVSLWNQAAERTFGGTLAEDNLRLTAESHVGKAGRNRGLFELPDLNGRCRFALHLDRHSKNIEEFIDISRYGGGFMLRGLFPAQERSCSIGRRRDCRVDILFVVGRRLGE
jgi:PAS domain-containing protein